MQYRFNHRTDRRQGMVLLVVMAMLALFASTALAFVFYADAEAVSAKSARESTMKDYADIDPEVLMAYFLNQFIYPTNNPYSAMRGWELSRSIYGFDPRSPSTNYVPYNGVGREALRYNDPILGVNNFDMINYQKYSSVAWDRHPEHYGRVGDANHRYVGGANPPWTSFDTNSLFLAQVTADGTTLIPSFYRPWLASAAAAAPAGARKHMSLRPDPLWNPVWAGSLLDSDASGDVKNRVGGPGGNDSIWIDLGFPVMTAPNGKRYKPLFAVHVVDLANRLHLWAHGNRIGNGNTPVSNQGHGSPEVNLGLLPNMQFAEFQNLIDLRYGGKGAGPAGSAPTLGNTFGFPGARPFHSRIDADGRDSSTGGSSKQPFTGFTTTGSAVVPGNQTMTVIPAPMPGGFPWAVPEAGNFLDIDYGAPQYEKVKILTTPSATSFTAVFTKAHPGNPRVDFSSFFPFPNFPLGYDNANNGGGAQDEITQKPLGMNIFNLPGMTPQGPPPASHMEALLRFGDTNAPALHSSIFRDMPTTMSDRRARNLVTLLNRYFDRIGVSPYISWDRNQQTLPGAGPYRYTASGYPKIIPYPVPAPDYSGTNPLLIPKTSNSDYGPDWRSTLGNQLRVNLNRTLADYPPQNVGGIIDTSNAAVVNQYNLAVGERQAFAREIYGALIRVVGAQDPNVVNVIPTSVEYKAARWLSQLAVNIVDYIDNDDYCTPFLWDTQGNGDLVFGTELPRLVLNEAYAQYDNDPGDPGLDPKVKGKGASRYHMNIWTELHNPFANSGGNAYPRDNGIARLALNGNAVYQILVCQSSAALSTAMRDPGNNFGDPNFGGGPSPILKTVDDWGATAITQNVLPAGGASADPLQTNNGYYVLGSNATFLRNPLDPGLPTTHKTGQMSIKVNNPNTEPFPVTLVLQRLANPHLPPQKNANQALYNPYITVDYLDYITCWDTRAQNANGNNNNGGTPKDFASFGRKHPYSAYHNTANPAQSQIVLQTTKGSGTQPNHTFFSLNAPNDAPFAWLTHLDRPLVNQLELLHVSGFKPHELTQQFIVNNTRFQHYAPWLDASSGLYRVLDLLGTPNNMLGSVRGGRWHGNININTLNDLEVFQALCDEQSATQTYGAFTAAEVQSIATKLIVSRTGNASANIAPLGMPTVTTDTSPNGNQKPFKSFGAGDILDTLFRSDPGNARQPLFAVGAATNHPYQRAALLQKIFNNIGTTSNAFAVWYTVGFFEVVDESVRPERLGAEIGRSEGRHVRHRFFAIVDRSGLQLFNTSTSQGIAAGTDKTVTVQAVIGTLPGGTQAWAMQPGMLLEVNDLANPAANEVVVVKAVDQAASNFTADFAFAHGAGGVQFICRGNPGPQPTNTYNPRKDTNVVLHMSVIQ